MALPCVSRLRAVGREDLAAFLEMAIRGGNLPGSLKEENKSPEPVDNENPPLLGGEEKADRGMPAELQKRPVPQESSSESQTRSGAASGDHSNPFKLT